MVVAAFVDMLNDTFGLHRQKHGAEVMQAEARLQVPDCTVDTAAEMLQSAAESVDIEHQAGHQVVIGLGEPITCPVHLSWPLQG